MHVEVDLRDRAATFDCLFPTRPDVVVARVRGLVANDTYPAEFLFENLQIQVDLTDAGGSRGRRQAAAVPHQRQYRVRWISATPPNT